MSRGIQFFFQPPSSLPSGSTGRRLRLPKGWLRYPDYDVRQPRPIIGLATYHRFYSLQFATCSQLAGIIMNAERAFLPESGRASLIEWIHVRELYACFARSKLTASSLARQAVSIALRVQLLRAYILMFRPWLIRRPGIQAGAGAKRSFTTLFLRLLARGTEHHKSRSSPADDAFAIARHLDIVTIRIPLVGCTLVRRSVSLARSLYFSGKTDLINGLQTTLFRAAQRSCVFVRSATIASEPAWHAGRHRSGDESRPG